MAVGAYSCYKLMTAFPDVSMFVHVMLAGVITAIVGVLFGLPSLRIKGFLSGGRDTCGAVLSGLVVQPRGLVLQLFGVGSDQRSGAGRVRSSDHGTKHRRVGVVHVLPGLSDL